MLRWQQEPRTVTWMVKMTGKPASQSIHYFVLCHLILVIVSILVKSQPAYCKPRPEEKQQQAAAAAPNQIEDTIVKQLFNPIQIKMDHHEVRQKRQSDAQYIARLTNLQQAMPGRDLVSLVQQSTYKCAKHCSCSTIQVLDTNQMSESTSTTSSLIGTNLVNLTRAKCESAQFSDVLTIDRRTQIIHISLPFDKSILKDYNATRAMEQQQQALSQKGRQNDNKGNSLFKMSSVIYGANDNGSGKAASSLLPPTPDMEANRFRMPRLAQFDLLREIVIINLKFEVCDSEVFKRGQRLRRLRWNLNQLKQITKHCFRHLNKLVELNLDYNQLAELESALFSGLTNLKHLSLAYNRLSELAAHQFANLTQLISLNLVGNTFKSINLHLFEPMQNSLRLLVLAKNQIKSFVYQTNAPIQLNKLQQSQQQVLVTSNSSGKLRQLSPILLRQRRQSSAVPPVTQASVPTIGVLFKNLIKLNVDFNKFERIKLLQLHRFFNVKFLSIRGNQIASIRDRAFNGLKLIELNLAQNKLQLISKCAFCNSTIKRLILAQNNISLPLVQKLPQPSAQTAPLSDSSSLPPLSIDGQHQASAQQLVAPPPTLPLPQSQLLANDQIVEAQPVPTQYLNAASSASMLVLSQSILGPLFNHLEYLDLSHNKHLTDQLELLLEPLLELQYLNLAAIGLDRSLPTPSLFKNLRQLKYLNLSMNQLDLLIAETVEPLIELELLDLSSNQFNEMDESFLVSLDELPKLKYVNLGSNPWYCSQCKISPLHDWIMRSSIYNSTCMAQQLLLSHDGASPGETSGSSAGSVDVDDSSEQGSGLDDAELDLAQQPPPTGDSSGLIYRQTSNKQAQGHTDYSLLGDGTASNGMGDIDFDLILDLYDSSSTATNGLGSGTDNEATLFKQLNGPNYQFLFEQGLAHGLALDQTMRKKQLSERLVKVLATSEDDESVASTITSLIAANQLAGDNGELVLRNYFSNQDFCMKCEFPSELRAFNLHELAPTDFKYCLGSAPRFTASEPKIGLTLAIVIIGALLCVIIVVIIIYRKKSNAYYPDEDLTDQLEAGGGATGAVRKSQPVLSVSSDLEHPYGGGDATDYSSPPMSQSYESYSNDDELDEDEQEDEEGDEEEDEQIDEDYIDEDEELEEEEEDVEEEEENEMTGEESRYDEDHEGDDGNHGRDKGGLDGSPQGNSGGTDEHHQQNHHHHQHDETSHQNDGNIKQHHDPNRQHGPTGHGQAELAIKTTTSSGGVEQVHKSHLIPSDSDKTATKEAAVPKDHMQQQDDMSTHRDKPLTKSVSATRNNTGEMISIVAINSDQQQRTGNNIVQANYRDNSRDNSGSGETPGRVEPKVSKKSRKNNPPVSGESQNSPVKEQTGTDERLTGSAPSGDSEVMQQSSFVMSPLDGSVTLPTGLKSRVVDLAPANLSAVDLSRQAEAMVEQQAGITKQQQEEHSKQSAKLVQLANMAGSLHEAHKQVRTKRSSGLRQSQTTLGDRRVASTARSPEEKQQRVAPTPPSSFARPGYQHRQSSEHSTAGSVSFKGDNKAKPQRYAINQRSMHNNPGRASPNSKRNRLRNASQTICIDVNRPLTSAMSGAESQSSSVRRFEHSSSVRVAPGGTKDSLFLHNQYPVQRVSQAPTSTPTMIGTTGEEPGLVLSSAIEAPNVVPPAVRERQKVINQTVSRPIATDTMTVGGIHKQQERQQQHQHPQLGSSSNGHALVDGERAARFASGSSSQSLDRNKTHPPASSFGTMQANQHQRHIIDGEYEESFSAIDVMSPSSTPPLVSSGDDVDQSPYDYDDMDYENRYAGGHQNYGTPAHPIVGHSNLHPIRRLQQQHRNVISPSIVDDRSSASTAIGHHQRQTGPPPRVQPRHRHHIKQNLAEAIDGDQSGNFEDAPSISMTLDRNSFELASHNADMVGRDLDGTDVHQAVSNNGDVAAGASHSSGQARYFYANKQSDSLSRARDSGGGGALERVEDDEDDYGVDENYIEMLDNDRHLKLAYEGPGTSTRARIRASSSTHSALTQTGSRDFD